MISYSIAIVLGVLMGLLASTGVAMILWIATVLSGSAASAKNSETSIEDKDHE